MPGSQLPPVAHRHRGDRPRLAHSRVTYAWRAPGVNVRGFEIVDINNGTCTKIRLRLDMDEAGKQAGIPTTVILKGGFEPHSREWHYMHEREVRGYRDVFPVLHLPTPACYFADYDPDRRQGIVIMEDLVARGVTFCSALRPQTHAQVARRLSVLARHHAQTWDSPEFAPGGRWAWTQDIAAVARHYFSQYLVPEVWQRFVTLPLRRGGLCTLSRIGRGWKEHLIATSVCRGRFRTCADAWRYPPGEIFIDPDGAPGFFDLRPIAPGDAGNHPNMVCALDLADRWRWEGALVRALSR